MLADRVVLTISAFGRTAAFEFRDHSPTREISREFLVGNRGAVVSTLYEQATDIDPTEILPEIDNERRAGFHLDAGGGRSVVTIQADVGAGDDGLRWGDGSSAAEDATPYDAAGDVHPHSKRDVLLRYLSQARTDSGAQADLHIGEWTDGSFSESAGVYGEPIPVAIGEVRAESPKDEPSTVSYTIECIRTQPVPDAVDEAVDDLSAAAQDAVDAVGELVPDY